MYFFVCVCEPLLHTNFHTDRLADPPASATGLEPPLALSSPAKRPTVAQQFITRTAAAGISINAWFLLGFVHTLIKHPALRNRIPFNTRLLSEQAAERLFRAVRAVLGGENFTLSDFFRRCDRVVAYSILRVLHEDFIFPEHSSSWKWDETQKSDMHTGPLSAAITEEAVITAIMDAKLQCISDMLAVGVDVNKFKAIYHLDDGTLNELDEDEDLSGVHEDVTVPAPAEAVQIVTAVRSELCIWV